MKPAPGLGFYYTTSYSPKFLLFLTIFSAGIIAIVVFTNNFSAESNAILLSSAAGLPLVGLICFFALFTAWKTNISKINFEVKGWSELMAQPDLIKQRVWRDLKVEVHLRQQENGNVVAANAILKRFTAAANTFDMSHKMGDKKRSQWMITDSPLTMYGSADRSILNFLLFHLSLLKNVDHVTIEQKGNSYKIEPEIDTMS